MGKDDVGAARLDALAWIVRGAARLKELAAHGKRMRLVEFAPGFADPNWCSKAHVVYVLAGAIESHYEDGVSVRRAGDAYIVPAGVPHRSCNPPDAPARLLIVDEG